MRDRGATGGPQPDYDVEPVHHGSGTDRLHRRDPPPLQRDGSPIAIHGDQIAGGKRETASDFRIIVAARIRPFTEREVRQWRLERRAAAAAAAEELDETTAGAGRSGASRSAMRQPFGPDHRALNLAVTTTTQAQTGGGGLTDDHGHLLSDHGSLVTSPDRGSVPAPVVEVESDGRTIVLLEPPRTAADVNGGGVVVRNAFTYDYVYSSLEPGVQLNAELIGGQNDGGLLQLLEASPLRHLRRSVAGSYIIAEAESGAPAQPSGGAAHTLHTPEEEAQAEAEQVAIYQQLAIPLVDAALDGYNTCMFAYGQTGSGKTYTMMGTTRHPGLIPRLCQLLFAQVAQRNGEGQGSAGAAASASPPSSAAAVTLQLSYLEIYNEQVRDLLKQRPKNALLRYRSRFDKKDIDSDEYRTLKVRHHPSKGVYVDGLTTVPVHTWAECEELLQHGNALRTQCSTAMNAKSSRSHAIFQFQVTQREATVGRVRGRDVAPETFSKINLVDLAGSERNTQSKTTGKHLAEANSINASLSTLRRVLDGLVNNSGGKKAVVIPYRESLLTYILSDNLGGNSLTVMCANVSPCAADKGETESTLRYANLARAVVNHARLNEAPTARIIREMREQIKTMQEALRKAPSPAHVAELEEGVLLSEQLLREMRGREEAYEARLQAAEAERAELRKVVAAHEAGEKHWRDEAQRRQDEVESLRSALRVAMSATSTAAPAQVEDEGDGASAAAAAGDAEDGAATAAPVEESPTARQPTKDKKKKAKKPARRLSSLSSREIGRTPSNAATAAAAAAAAAVVVKASAEARQRRPSKPRAGAADAAGRPLSLAALREASRPGGVVLPSLRSVYGGESAAAAPTPSKALSPSSPRQRRSSQSPAQPASRSPSKVRRVSLSSIHLATPPQQQQPSHEQAPSRPAGGPSGPRSKKKNAAKAAARDTAADAPLAGAGRAPTGAPSGPLAESAASAAGLSARGYDTDEAPSFYQTVSYLTGAGAKLDGSSSVATSSARDGDEGGDDRGAGSRNRRILSSSLSQRTSSDGAAAAPAVPHPPPAPRLEPQKRSRQRNTRGLEIEGGSPAPTSTRWPTNSPNVAAARQARAARDRRASSEAAVVPSASPVSAVTPAGQSPLQRTPARPSKLPANAEFGCRVSAEVNVRKTHRSTAASPGSTNNSTPARGYPPGAPSVGAHHGVYPDMRPVEVGDLASYRQEGEQRALPHVSHEAFSRDAPRLRSATDSEGGVDTSHPYSHLLETLPAGVARPQWPGEQQQQQALAQRALFPSLEAADSQGPPAAATSAAAAPSPSHSLASSLGRKPSRQHGRAQPQNASNSSSFGERHYSTVDMLGSVR